MANISYFYNFGIATAQTVDSQFDSLFDLLVANEKVVNSFKSTNFAAYTNVKAKLIAAASKGI